MLRFTYGTMAAGKSTLALQLHWQLAAAGRRVALWTFGDRSGGGNVTSRLGLRADAIAWTPTTPAAELLEAGVGENLEYLVVDEAQCATGAQIDAIAELVDEHHVEAHLFGLGADFTLTVFDGAARLFAIADVVSALPVDARCWCGKPGRCNARIGPGGDVLRAGPQTEIGDVNEHGAGATYEVLCRVHYRHGVSKARSGTAT